MPEAADSCDKCGKLQSELSRPLKRCAKCQTGKYCSRDCQKADFKSHKRECKAPTSGIPGSLTNPAKEDITKGATENIDLFVALKNTPDMNQEDARLTTVPILKHLLEFCMSTHNKYWGRLLQPKLSVELAGRTSHTPDEDIAENTAQMERLQEEHGLEAFDMNRWPDFKEEVYRDAMSRNAMAAMIVADESKQMMFGQPPGQTYQWGEEVLEVVKKQLGEESFNKFRRGGESRRRH